MYSEKLIISPRDLERLAASVVSNRMSVYLGLPNWSMWEKVVNPGKVCSPALSEKGCQLVEVLQPDYPAKC